MDRDPWTQLHRIATSEDENATIVVYDDPRDVDLIYSDGSRASLEFRGGIWRFVSTTDSAPCDVAARDTF